MHHPGIPGRPWNVCAEELEGLDTWALLPGKSLQAFRIRATTNGFMIGSYVGLKCWT